MEMACSFLSEMDAAVPGNGRCDDDHSKSVSRVSADILGSRPALFTAPVLELLSTAPGNSQAAGIASTPQITGCDHFSARFIPEIYTVFINDMTLQGRPTYV